MNRILLDGTIVPAFDIAVELRVVTKCPSKYKLTDMETGEEYVGNIPNVSPNHYFWKRLNA
jgi:hypothetical protein|tara:strand:+ start:1577 stop:1759 length:183 start_codon:yes stop_codon:yes gene_type:complete